MPQPLDEQGKVASCLGIVCSAQRGDDAEVVAGLLAGRIVRMSREVGMLEGLTRIGDVRLVRVAVRLKLRTLHLPFVGLRI